MNIYLLKQSTLPGKKKIANSAGPSFDKMFFFFYKVIIISSCGAIAYIRKRIHSNAEQPGLNESAFLTLKNTTIRQSQKQCRQTTWYYIFTKRKTVKRRHDCYKDEKSSILLLACEICLNPDTVLILLFSCIKMIQLRREAIKST